MEKKKTVKKDVKVAKKVDATLQSPWVLFANKVRELFKLDPKVEKMTWNDDTLELKIYVNDEVKAAALSHILPSKRAFGKNVVKIFVIPANVNSTEKTYCPEVLKLAFDGNPLFKEVITLDHVFDTNPVAFLMFNNQVVQYFSDNLSHPYGITSCLAEDLARDVFKGKLRGTLYATDYTKKKKK